MLAATLARYSFVMTHRWKFTVTIGALLAALATAGQSQAPQSSAASRRTAAAEAKVAQDADWGIVRMEPATLKMARTAPRRCRRLQE